MLKQDWFAVPPGKIYPELFSAGSALTGELLAEARALGLIAEGAPEVAAAQAAPENKRGRRK